MIKITMEIPPQALSPNSRGHWRKKANATKLYRQDGGIAAWMAIRAMPSAVRTHLPWTKVEMQMTFFRKTNGRYDSDNALASMKAGIDSLVDAKLLADDNQITHLPVIITKDAKDPRVEIVIRRLE